jgi:hypothetical protein
MNKTIWFTALSGLVIYACTGTGTGTETQNPNNPLKSFQDSGCKKAGPKKSTTDGETATAAQALVSTDYSAETRGLQCLAWETVGNDGLKIDLYNFEGDCGSQWSGQAALESNGRLGLTVANPECVQADCGYCIFDWSFEVTGVDTSHPVSIDVNIDACPRTTMQTTQSVLLPVAENSSGILCRYANFDALMWQAAALSECGTQGMPCQGIDMCQTTSTTTEPSCTGDLVCTNNGDPNQPICTKACTNDEDCGSHGVLTCKDGLCRPKANW